MESEGVLGRHASAALNASCLPPSAPEAGAGTRDPSWFLVGDTLKMIMFNPY